MPCSISHASHLSILSFPSTIHPSTRTSMHIDMDTFPLSCSLDVPEPLNGYQPFTPPSERRPPRLLLRCWPLRLPSAWSLVLHTGHQDTQTPAFREAGKVSGRYSSYPCVFFYLPYTYVEISSRGGRYFSDNMLFLGQR